MSEIQISNVIFIMKYDFVLLVFIIAFLYMLEKQGHTSWFSRYHFLEQGLVWQLCGEH